MTKDAGAELPVPLREVLDGRDLERKEGETFLLLTIGEDGYPRVALLSVGEVYAPSAREVRLALWPRSTTTTNLGRTGRATLAWIQAGPAHYVELDATRRGDAGPFARFDATVRSARTDVVGYADLTSGVRFRLKDRAEVLARWRQTIETLRT